MNMEQQLPLCSVIVANFNYGHFISDAVVSISKQDYPAKEIIICDDCSTDNSLDVVKSLCSIFSQENEDEEKVVYQGAVNNVKLTYLSIKRNGGPSRARNIGIKFSWDKTHIYGVVDSDDIIKQGKVSKCVMKILEAPEIVGITYTDYDILNTVNNTIVYESRPPYDLFALRQNFILHSGMFFSKKALERSGLYDEELRTCEDFDISLRICDYYMAVHIPENLSVVRVQPNNSTDTVAKETWERNYRRTKEKMIQRITGGA